jgi:AcrR family transcriptional regulator
MGQLAEEGEYRLPLHIKPAVKRKAGQRAKMTRAKITTAAAKLWQKVGPDKFAVRALARKLNIVPTTVYAHFHGREPELRKEIARVTLEALTPHYQPKLHPKDYLRAFLLRFLESFRQSPHLGRLVIVHLTDDPMLSLGFVERMSMTIKALGGGQDLIDGVELLVSRLSGLALIEIGKWTQTKPDAQRTRIGVLLINTPQAEVPTLKSVSSSLGTKLSKRSADSYLADQADRLADTLIAEWTKS